MSLELLNALAALGTFMVITASAIAAVIQLRHLRASNQLQTFMTITDKFDSPDFQKRLGFVRNELPNLLHDPEFRSQYFHPRGADRSKHPEFTVCGFFEELGMFVKRGLIDRDVFLDAYCRLIIRHWEMLAPFVAISRKRGGPAVWENFEFLASLSHDWNKRYPDGTLPKSFRRLPLPEVEVGLDELGRGSTGTP